MPQKPAYLIMDIETVVDGRLVQRARYPDQPDLKRADAVKKFKEELVANGQKAFVPHTYHVPVSVAMGKVNADLEMFDLVSLDRPAFRPRDISRKFWNGLDVYGYPTLVTFNGRGFDLPVMELAAFRYGHAAGHWFKASGSSYTHPRNRFNMQAHEDLQDLLSNYGSCRMGGGLNTLATILGLPGKMDTDGSMVQGLWEKGEHLRIDNYCMCDVLDTYFVFLRSKVLRGTLSFEEEGRIIDKVKHTIAAKATENEALREYLNNMHIRR